MTEIAARTGGVTEAPAATARFLVTGWLSASSAMMIVTPPVPPGAGAVERIAAAG